MTGTMRLASVFALVIASPFAQSVSPEQAQAAAVDSSIATFRSETNLVLVRFQMTPKKGQPSALGPGDIEVREDGVAQKIAVFQGGEAYPQTVPVEVNLLLTDLRSIVDPRTFTLNFGALDDHERVSVAIWAIGRRLVRLSAPTRNAAMLERARQGVLQVWSTSPTKGRPSVFKSIATLVREAAQGRTNVIRILAVVSTGDFDENESGAFEAIRAARDSSVAIFPVLLRDDSIRQSFANLRGQVEDAARRAHTIAEFESLAKDTDGRELAVGRQPFGDTLNPVFTWLGGQIRSDYVIGFYPVASSERRPHKVQVILKDSKRGEIVGSTRTIEH